MNIELGEQYRDSVTGFKGMATGHTRYLFGSDLAYLEPQARDDGTGDEGRWFEISRLQQVIAPRSADLVPA